MVLTVFIFGVAQCAVCNNWGSKKEKVGLGERACRFSAGVVMKVV